MSLPPLKLLITLLATAALLTACGGSGRSVSPPVGGISLEPGEGGVTVTWTGVPGVEYWLYTAQAASICKNCGNSGNNWNSVVGAQSRGWAAPISSPYFFSGSTIDTSLNNDVVYSFIMDGRINGGAGGEATPSVSTTPRLAGRDWSAGGAIGSGGITALAFGPLLNSTTNTYATTGTYLGVGSNGTNGLKYQSTDGVNWTALSTTDTPNWKSATHAFPNTTIQKFVSVGAGGAAAYSTDLVNWATAANSTTVAANQDLNAVASSNNLLVAVGNHGTIVRSTDGNTWVAASSVPSTPDLYAVKYATVASNAGLWVAVGAGGVVWISADAASWTAVNSGTVQDLKGVASVVNTTYPNGIYNRAIAPTISYSVVAIGNSGTVIQSTDASTWTARTVATSQNLNAIVASSALLPTNQFMVVGDGGKAFTSPDGVTWTSRTTTTTQNLIGLIRGLHNQYLAWAADGTTVYSK